MSTRPYLFRGAGWRAPEYQATAEQGEVRALETALAAMKERDALAAEVERLCDVRAERDAGEGYPFRGES